MGLSSDIHNIIKTVKRIPGIPNEVYNKLKYDLRDLSKKIDGIDLNKFGASIIGEVTRIVNGAFDGVQVFVNKKIADSQQFIQMSLDTINAQIEDSFGNVEGLIGKIPEYFNDAIAKIQETLINPITGFFKQYFLPLIIGAIVVFISPILFPLLGFVFK